VKAHALAVVVVILAGGHVDANPRRAGFTAEVGVGIGHHQVVQGYDSKRSFEAFGVMPFAFSLGRFVTEEFAIVMSSTTSLFRHDRGDGARFYLGQYLGVGVEYWLRADLALGATGGLDVLMTSPVENHLARSVGLALRGKWTPTPQRASGLHLIWELNGGVYLTYEVVVTSSLLAAWQWY
jgi:hypothetical protein